MRIADLLTAVILALGGGLVVYDSVRLGIGWGSDGPRSGFFPFWLAVIMIVACVAIMLQALRRTPTEPFLTRERQYEMCDAVQDESYEVDGVEVSNFLLPLYFT